MSWVVNAFMEGLYTSLKSPSSSRPHSASSTKSSALGSFGSKTFKLKDRHLGVVKQVGEGGFAFVYLVREIGSAPHHAEDTEPSQPLALKVVRLQLAEQERALNVEIAALRTIVSPHVIKLLDHEIQTQSKKDARALLLFPYYKGSVQDLLKEGPIQELQKILSIAKDVLHGLQAFHTRDPPLAFRDLKPANILLSDTNRAVLTDLGSVAEARVPLTTRAEALRLQDLCAETVTAPFRAPELFEPSTAPGREVTEKTDIWAFGCTVFTMAYGEPPFDGTATATVCGKVMFPKAPVYPAGLQDMILKTLSFTPAERPSVDELLNLIENLQQT
ncbi:Serine/threonine-protein kinase 16 [Phlyctochytrium bullatum]|nr:Serine/threonine-protein kinase 16 [Phlyctochytrium bullatum]